MLLQRQYSLWKLVNTIIVYLMILSIFAVIWLKWKISNLESSIKEETQKITKLNKEISTIKRSDEFKVFRTADIILEKESNINYYALYKFLNMVKQSLAKKLQEKWIKRNRFILKVDKDKVNISLLVPNYNMLADKDSDFLESITSKSFVKWASIKSYESKDNYIYFNIDLFTK